MNIKSKDKGTITELECAVHFMKLGYIVSSPIGDNAPYDLVVDINHKLYKIQCKHSSFKNGALYIECTTNTNTRTRLETRGYSEEDVDYFATCYDGICYLVPYSEVGKSFTLRLDTPKNNNSIQINWAWDYEVSLMIKKMLDPKYEYDMQTPGYVATNATSRSFFWITNGLINKQIKDLNDIPEGYWVGRSDKCNQFT